MDGVEGINLNGTDYEVQDKTARGAQSALDERVDNIGTVIEEQVTPLSERADELEAEAEAQETRIQALEGAKGGLSLTKVLENANMGNGSNVTGLGANKNTIGFIIRIKTNPTGWTEDHFIMTTLPTQSQETLYTHLTGACFLSGTSGSTVYYDRETDITCGGTNYSNWKIAITYGQRQTWNSTTKTVDDDIAKITDIWRVDNEV